MAEVVSLDDKRREREPHITGWAKCLQCGGKWVAVVHATGVAEKWLECKFCQTNKARFVNHVEIDGAAHWTCKCGNDLFFATPTCFYCPNCGAVQNMGNE